MALFARVCPAAEFVAGHHVKSHEEEGAVHIRKGMRGEVVTGSRNILDQDGPR
jgi:hypothetical protein